MVKKALSDPVQRKQLITQWLTDYQATQTNRPFSIDTFWQYAEEKALEIEIEDSPPLGLADY